MSPINQMICAFLGCLIGAGITTASGLWLKYSLDQWKKQSEPQSGLISGRIIDEAIDYIVIFGSFTRQMKGQVLKKGIDLSSFGMKIQGVSFPIKIYEDNRSIMIDASIFDAKNQPICQIVKNNWEIQPKGYQINNSVNALEIVDENQSPILQIYLEEPNKIFIGGAFFGKDGKRWNFFLDGITDMDLQQQTLFKYPSSEHKGQLNENGPFFNLKKRESEIQDYRDKINHLSDSELKQLTMNFVYQLREFFLKAETDGYQAHYEKDIKTLVTENETKKNQIWEISAQEDAKRSRQLKSEYSNKFAAKSIAFKDELTFRLKKFYGNNLTIKSLIEYETTDYHKKAVADNLEYLVKYLTFTRNLSNQQLCDETFKLVSEIREYQSRVNQEKNQLSLQQDKEYKLAKLESEKNKLWYEQNKKSSQLSAKHRFEYDKNLKIDILLLRDQLLSHLHRNLWNIKNSYIENPMIPGFLNIIGNNLELLAKYIEAGYDKLDNEELKQNVIDFIDQLKKFVDNCKQESDYSLNDFNKILQTQSNNPEDILKIVKALDYSTIAQRQQSEYYTKLRPYSIIFRDELLFRLGESNKNNEEFERYDGIQLPEGINKIINELEEMVQRLVGTKAMDEEKVFPITIKHKDNISGPPEPNELRSILLKNGKAFPDNMQVQVKAPRVPNHAHIYIKLPDQTEFEDLGDLPIVEGTVHLPVPLVFLSHASEDADAVGKINSDLRRAGILTWFDKQDLLPGDDWRRKIEEAIESSDYVLVFLSPRSVKKQGTFQREIKYAFDQMLERPSGESYIIPILLEDCEPPREFSNIHWSFAWKDNWFELLLKSLRR